VHVGDAEERLRELLGEAGLDLERLDPRQTWDVFKAFASEPVEGPGPDSGDDMCLFEYGVYDWSDGKGPRFHWGFCRQFSLYDEAGEYDHMEQLRCDLFFEVTPDLEQLTLSGIWSDDDLARWIEEVEAQDGFRAVVGLVPVESRVQQEEV
jgi:hypothetical protein